ncbi:hypothetical protein MRX96_036854 [Rhipicephalus microplus]
MEATPTLVRNHSRERYTLDRQGRVCVALAGPGSPAQISDTPDWDPQPDSSASTYSSPLISSVARRRIRLFEIERERALMADTNAKKRTSHELEQALNSRRSVMSYRRSPDATRLAATKRSLIRSRSATSVPFKGKN